MNGGYAVVCSPFFIFVIYSFKVEQLKSKTLAKTSKRVFATLLDYTVFFLATYVYLIYFGEETNEGYEVNGIMVLPILILWFFYYILVEGFMQATLGHQLFGMKICREDFDEIDVGHSFKRRILDFIDFSFFGIPALLLVRSGKSKQRIGDLLAKTIVVND